MLARRLPPPEENKISAPCGVEEMKIDVLINELQN